MSPRPAIRRAGAAAAPRLPIEDFDYDLPPQLIAGRPCVPRDAARMLDIGDGLRDAGVRDLPGFLMPGDIVVFNETRVIPARLTGMRGADPKTGRGAAKIEATLFHEEDSAAWRALARPAKRLRPGDRLVFAADFAAEVIEKSGEGEILLRFDRSGDSLRAALAAYGAMPLPPYISHLRPPDARDKTDYQTMFARYAGAVAAPTAGLHFTPELMAALQARGVRAAPLTLHVGPGTFLPVKTENVLDHRMHAETGFIPEETARAVNAARESGGRVLAVGTTVLRLLETAAQEGRVNPFAGDTDIFITPGYRFRAVDLLFTNFHLPRSTLFILVCAFAGTARMHEAYAYAIAAKYRFYSYGDSCLIHRERDN